jgi:hypothetical protein
VGGVAVKTVDFPCSLRVTFSDNGEALNYWPVLKDTDGLELPLRGGPVCGLDYSAIREIDFLLQTKAARLYLLRKAEQLERGEGGP